MARPGAARGRLLGAAGVALAGPLLPVDGGAPHTPTAEVAAVQGNVPRARNLPDLLRADTVTANHAAATRQLAARVRAGTAAAPDVVIWPENSTDQDPRANPYIYATITQAVTAINRPVLVGAILQDPVRNAGQLWRPGVGPVQDYVKRQLVPFGETIPMRSFLDNITSLPSLQPVNFTPGHKAVVFHVGKIRIGDVICYEVGFDGLVSSEVAAGANLLTVQTNDADFELDGQTGETPPAAGHGPHPRRRARPGRRGGLDHRGQRDHRAGRAADRPHRPWERAELEARVPLRTGTTLADRLGGWPEVVLTGATLAALAWALAGAIAERRRRRPGGRRPARGCPGRGRAELTRGRPARGLRRGAMAPGIRNERHNGTVLQRARAATWRGLRQPVRWAVLLAGALPVLAFPDANLELLAWVGLVPGLLLMVSAPTGARRPSGAGGSAPATCWPRCTG